jgi:hypothetical protein
VGEDQPNNNAGRAVERVTIAQAAAVLGCHPNTVRSRVKAGMYRAEKFHTENGPTWMIERDSLTNNAPTSASQQAVSGVPVAQQEAIQELARSIVREAGISREDAGLLENDKAHAEFFRTIAFLNTALLASIAATAAFLPKIQYVLLLFWTVAINLIGIMASLFVLVIATGVVGNSGSWAASLRRHRFLAGIFAELCFGGALIVFVWFVALNLNVP